MPVLMHRKFAMAVLSAAISSAFLVADFGFETRASAQSVSGKSRINDTLFLRQERLKNAVELNRLGADRAGVLLLPGVINRGLGVQNRAFGNRSGVRFGNGIRNQRTDNNLRLFERQRLNALRNIAIKEQRSGVRQGTARNDLFFQDNGSANFPVGNNTITRGAPACPAGHNCGYRLYDNGTGPRIITPGVGGLTDGLPAFDGVNGPLVITVE